MKSKAKIFKTLIKEIREKHRLLCVETREKAIELGKPFVGMRVAFRNPKVKNKTYKMLGLELKHLSLLPVKSKKRKSTGFLCVRNNASFFGYTLSDIRLDSVKMQNNGYDQELLKIERTLHEEFSNKTRAMMMSTELDMIAGGMIDADTDLYLASIIPCGKGYILGKLNNSSRYTGKIKGLEYDPSRAEINIKVVVNYQGECIISCEEHIVNIWD